MSKKVFFKIVVPNCNNMPYIKKCLDSILQQTFQDFFVVVADDMSTDCSDKFCEAYERIYPEKLKLLRLEKKGYAGAARNKGLEWDGVEPEYVWFVDSDDWLSGNDVLQLMHDKIVEAQMPDLLRVDVQIWNGRTSRLMKGESSLESIAKHGKCAPWWSCIRSKFSGIKFAEDRAKCNDVLWFARLLDVLDPSSVATVNSPCYVYNECSSTSAQHSKAKHSDACKEAEELCRQDISEYQTKTKYAQMFKYRTLKNDRKTSIEQNKTAAKDIKTVEKKNDIQTKQDKDACFFKIIIPNYNNMPYIKKCLDSILNQTFQDFKIVVVDDLSTDMSDKFCEAYARQHPDKIIYQQVKQKSYAGICRNIAIDYPIKCQYIWAIDGDDYLINNKVLEILYKYAKTLKYDAIFFTGYKEDKNKKLAVFNDRKKIDLTKWTNCDPTYHTCCIAKTNCYGKYLENISIGEDLYHSYLTLNNITTYINIDDKLYVYSYNKNSITKINIFKQKQIREQHRILLRQKLLELQKSITKNNIIKNIDERLQIIQVQIDKNAYSEKTKQIVIAMASFPPRKNGMLTVIKQLLPQCDKFCLWLNEYKEIPKELNMFDKNKLQVVLAGKNSDLKENGRYLFINENKDAYFLSVDDDINYPENYVEKIINKINKYNQKCIISFHGTIFDSNMNEKYFLFNANVFKDVQVHRVGGGVMGFIPNKIGFSCPNIDTLRSWDGDASISVWATNNNIKKYVVDHSSTYLTPQIDSNTKTKISDINALYLNSNTKNKRKNIYKQVKKWENIVDNSLKQNTAVLTKNTNNKKSYKIAIYTYCTNNVTGKQYQSVKYLEDNIDYYMFVDNKQKNEEKRNGWTVIQINQKEKYAVEDMNKYYKWHPTIIPNYKKYDYIIYIDSKVEILSNPNNIIESIKDNIPLGVCCHKYNYRTSKVLDNYKCLYKHIDYLIACPAGRPEKLKEWKKYLVSINFPKNQQFAETAVIITDMHNPNGIQLENEIFDMYLKASTLRDQIVIPLILAKKSYSIDQFCTLGKYITYQDEQGSKYFKNNPLTNINRRN